jgi:hypothetical protein
VAMILMAQSCDYLQEQKNICRNIPYHTPQIHSMALPEGVKILGTGIQIHKGYSLLRNNYAAPNIIQNNSFLQQPYVFISFLTVANKNNKTKVLLITKLAHFMFFFKPRAQQWQHSSPVAFLLPTFVRSLSNGKVS